MCRAVSSTTNLRTFAAVLVLVLSGCASNPYIANPRPAATPLAAFIPGTMDYAIQYADNAYDAYEAKFAEEFVRQQQLSGGLLTLGAITLGLVAGDANRNAFVGTALVGGLSYQLGTWNSSQSRPLIYLEGMKAISCAKQAIAPLRISEERLQRVRVQAATTRASALSAAHAAGEATRWLSITGGGPGTTPTPLQTATAAALSDTDATMRSAGALLGRAAGLDSRVDQAGQLFQGKLQDITGAVTGALNGTLSNLSELPKMVGSLSEYANVVVPGLNLGAPLKNSVAAANTALDSARSGTPTAESGPSPDASVQPVDPAARLAAALGHLRAKRSALEIHSEELNGALQATTLEQVKSGLTGCNVDSSKLATTLQVDRSTVSFTAGAAATALVGVSGGTLPYAVNLLDLPAPGINVTAPAGGAVVVVTASADAPAGRSFAARVSDATGAATTLTINVNAKTETTAPALATQKELSTTSAATCFGFEARTAEEICLIQHTLKVPADGIFGSVSCKAFRQDARTSGFNGLVNDQSMSFFKTQAGLGADADVAAIAAKLKALNVSCRVAASPAPAAAPKVAAALAQSAVCNAPAAGQACEAEGARCELECRMSKAEVRKLRARFALPETPERFDEDLRNRLAEFQLTRQLVNRKGEYTEETAAALQAKAQQ